MAHRLKIAGIVVFLLVDLLLVMYMINQTRDDRYGGAGADLEGLSTSGTPEEVEPTGAVSLIQGDGPLIRVTAGSCTSPGRPLLETSTDQGKSFEEVAVPVLGDQDEVSPPTVRTILTATSTSPDELTVVAGAEDCKPGQYSTTDGGLNWEKADKVELRYVNISRDEVETPDGARDPGCEVASLTLLGDGVGRVACVGGTIRATADGGQTWAVVGTLEGVRAAVFSAPKFGFAVAPSGDCKSAALETIDGGLSWQEQGCIDKKAEFKTLTGGPGRLTTGDAEKVLTSSDRGATWAAPEG